MIFGVVTRERLSLDTKVSEESTVSVFGVEMTLKIEADLSSEKLLSIDTTTRCQNTEHHDWDTRHPEDVIAYKTHRLLFLIQMDQSVKRRSQWPRGLWHEMSSLARTVGSLVRIPLNAWMSAFILCLCR
jgi:hypothetical protein